MSRHSLQIATCKVKYLILRCFKNIVEYFKVLVYPAHGKGHGSMPISTIQLEGYLSNILSSKILKTSCSRYLSMLVKTSCVSRFQDVLE